MWCFSVKVKSGMKGQRLHWHLPFQTLKAGGFPANTVSVIAGLTNDYADYVTTYEEYQVSICFCYIQGEALFLDSSDMLLCFYLYQILICKFPLTFDCKIYKYVACFWYHIRLKILLLLILGSKVWRCFYYLWTSHTSSLHTGIQQAGWCLSKGTSFRRVVHEMCNIFLIEAYWFGFTYLAIYTCIPIFFTNNIC